MLCGTCAKRIDESNTTVVTEPPASVRFKDMEFNIERTHRVCNTCGEDVFDNELDTETTKKLSALYKGDIPYESSDLLELRTLYGFGQPDNFAKAIGIPVLDYKRYEDGRILPNRRQMKLIVELHNNPELISKLWKENKSKITPLEMLTVDVKKLSKYIS